MKNREKTFAYEEALIQKFLDVVNSEAERQGVSFYSLGVRREVCPTSVYEITKRRRGISIWTMAKILNGLGIDVEFKPRA